MDANFLSQPGETRRKFLKQAGIAATVYRLAGPTPVLAAADLNSSISMGFIGVGIRGAHLAESFTKTPGVRATAVADLYDGRLEWAKETLGSGVATGKSYKALLDRKDIDAVTVAVPDHWHSRMVLDALDAGKHVYCEKPLTWSIDEGKAIIDKQKKTGKLVMVGSQSKTSVLIAKARELVKAGAIGNVGMVRMTTFRNSPGGAWEYAVPLDASEKTIDWNQFLGRAPKVDFDAKRFFRWRCWWEYSGGVATDLWVHLFTALHEMMDVKAPKSAAAQGGLFKWKDGRTVPDVLGAWYEYQNFLLDISVNLTNGRGNGNDIVVMGTAGTLTFGPRGDSVIVQHEGFPASVEEYGMGGWPKRARKEYLDSLGYKDGKIPGGKAGAADEEIPVPKGLEHYEYFVESLREGKPSRETAEEGHFAAGAAHLGNMSYRQNKKLHWDWASGRVS